jgi:hypothetical protein
LPVDRVASVHHNDIVVVMLPGLDAEGALPDGLHVASWEEIVETFGWTNHRRELLAGLADQDGERKPPALVVGSSEPRHTRST